MTTSETPPISHTHTTREWLYIALILIFALIIISPLFQPGYFWGAHDARHDAYFIFQYDKSVQDGIWFPRWSPDWTFGYGYPFFIVYGPLATFLGELFHHFLGLGFEASVKAVLALSIVVSGFAMYGFVRSWLGRNAGLVAAVAFMAIPYHLVDVYVRARTGRVGGAGLSATGAVGVSRDRAPSALGRDPGCGLRLRCNHVDQQPGGADFHAGAGGVRGDLDLLAVAPVAGRGGEEERRWTLPLPGTANAGARIRLCPRPRPQCGVLCPGAGGDGIYQPDAVVRRILRPDPAFRVLLPVVQPGLGLWYQPTRTGRHHPGRDELPVGRGRDAPLAGGAGDGPPAQALPSPRGLVLGAVGCRQHLPHAERLGPGLALPADRALRPVPVALSDAGDRAVEHPAGDVGG